MVRLAELLELSQRRLFLPLFIGVFLVIQSWWACLQLRQWLPLCHGASPAHAAGKIRILQCCGSCARGYSITRDTAKRSFTAVTKSTASACSLYNRGTNPVNLLLYKSPKERTSTCCSFCISIPLFWKVAEIATRVHLPRRHLTTFNPSPGTPRTATPLSCTRRNCGE